MTTPFSEPLDKRTEPRLQAMLARQFAPLDKRALAIAFGATLGLALFAVTVASLLVDHEQRFPLALLSQFVFGYTVSAVGACVAVFWGFVYGFVLGWVLALGRNTVLAFWLMKARIRADVRNSQDILDKI